MDKHYKPDIQDFRVGYEFETEFAGNWQKEVITSLDENSRILQVPWYLNHNKLRVPFLTQEQVEAEGWEFHLKEHGIPDGFFKKNGYYLHILINEGKLKIRISKVERVSYDCNTEPDIVTTNYFLGECPSINEFRTITQKQLNI